MKKTKTAIKILADGIWLNCHRCGDCTQVTRNQNRQWIEEGQLPWCGCADAAQPPTPEANHKQAARATNPKTRAGVILSVMTPGVEYPLFKIIVAAWLRDKTYFGLAHAEEAHPDSNRVYVEIVRMAKPGGPLEKVAPRTYRRKVVDTTGAAG